MKINSVFLLSLLVFFMGCKKGEIEHSHASMSKSVEINDVKIQFKGKKIDLNQRSKDVVEHWMEYQNIADFIPQLAKTSTKKILFNANQLLLYSQQLKDSIRIENFKVPSFKIRLNVLHNEALRLQDMDSIMSITPEEVAAEHHNIMEAFYAINLKIKALVEKEMLQDDLSEYNHIFSKKKDSLSSLKLSQNQRNKKDNRAKKKRIIKPFKSNKNKRKRRIEPLKAANR